MYFTAMKTVAIWCTENLTVDYIDVEVLRGMQQVPALKIVWVYISYEFTLLAVISSE